jgi:hypothetical protein
MLDSLAIATDGYVSRTVKKSLIIAVAGYLNYADEGTITKVFIKIGSVWKTAIVYIKVEGVWKIAMPNIKVAGIWK